MECSELCIFVVSFVPVTLAKI